MEIVIAAQGLAFGPTTIDHRSLGGSETAALQMARELRKLDHLVTIFCNLPPSGMPDFIPNGSQDDIGVRWVSLEQFGSFITKTSVDLLIVSRNPELLMLNHQAKKAVLWCHDLATYKGMLPRLMASAWNFDEVWTVSEYHKKQIHDVTGYPLENIRATRNGIVKFDSILEVPREPKSLLYSARPERGLELLVRPDGIMSKLPEFTLNVTMYENYPEQMMEYYHQLWGWAEKLPNVKILGPKTQLELRQMMRSSWLYAYPTSFEEVSCIIARECIEQKLPVLTTKTGALLETLGSCGYYMEKEIKDYDDTEQFISDYVEAIKYLDACPAVIEGLQNFCEKRDDLYWDKVAEQWIGWAQPKESTPYSLVVSMIKDADIIPAIAYMQGIDEKSQGLDYLWNELYTKYPFLNGTISIEDHYKGIYELEDSKKVAERQEMKTLKGVARFEEISGFIAQLPNGAHILEYGCAEGPVILGLAERFPDKLFTGIDFVEANINLCEKFAEENNIKNVRFFVGSTQDWPHLLGSVKEDYNAAIEGYDCAIIAEVLEHVEKPWEVTDFVETRVKLGGKIIITVPQGPWEWSGLQNLLQWPWRAHIWHIDKWMLRKMYNDKKECTLANITDSIGRDGRSRGHLIFTYTVDQIIAKPIDPIEKALTHRCRQSLAACVITMDDEQTILKTLGSIQHDIDQLQIAIGPSVDHTRQFIETWAKEHPWVETRIIDVPKIEAKVYGFDDARNASIEGIESDWILWIDSDEYISGEKMQVYLRNNCFDSYAIHQHHFTCVPRGEPAQLDKPARLIRNNHGFKFFGKVHEHAEIGFNGGPGFVMVINDIDIGHTGYVNDVARFKRFARNFPLLEWDQEVYPDRKLGRFLWLRDIIHRIRMMEQKGNKQEARRLAEEAIEFFNNRVRDLEGIGGQASGNTAVAYYGEALKALGRGYSMAIQVQFDEQVAQYAGIFESAEDAFNLATKAVTEEIKKRKSGYWQ